MKHTEYIGKFRANDGNEYSLTVQCNGFIQAFFLLTADAIRMGKHYQLASITDDKDNVRIIDDICKTNALIK